jgi:hypothetical protein
MTMGTAARESAPERTDDQRFEALTLANVVRTHRADLKGEWKGRPRPGRPRIGRSVYDVLRRPLPVEETWHLLDVLLALPKVGRVKANKYLQSCRMSPKKTVGGLSDRQRGELLALLGARR